MYSLHLTHPKWTHTRSSGQPCYSARGAVGGLVPCSRTPQSWYWRRILPPHQQSLPDLRRDSNPQPSAYKSYSLSIRPRLPKVFFSANLALSALGPSMLTYPCPPFFSSSGMSRNFSEYPTNRGSPFGLTASQRISPLSYWAPLPPIPCHCLRATGHRPRAPRGNPWTCTSLTPNFLAITLLWGP